MSLVTYFPIYSKLSPSDQEALLQVSSFHTVSQGTLLHQGGDDCMGLLVVKSGQLRVYMTSEDGREITLYRLFERDICLFAASCIMNSLQFDVMISAEKDTDFWLIPPCFYKQLMERDVTVSNYTNEIMSSRFTDVMWLMEQVMWKSFDKRLATFLLEEAAIEQSHQLKITHETIASHLGTAREVVTRMLKYFQAEGAVSLTRGTISIENASRLQQLSE